MTNQTTLSVTIALSLDNGIKTGLSGVIQQVREADKATDSFAARLGKILQITQLMNQMARDGVKLYQAIQNFAEPLAVSGKKGLGHRMPQDKSAIVAAAPLGAPTARQGAGDLIATARKLDAFSRAARPMVDSSDGRQGKTTQHNGSGMSGLQDKAKALAEIYQSAKALAEQWGRAHSGASTAGRSGARVRPRADQRQTDRSATGSGFDPFAAAKKVADFYLNKAQNQEKRQGKGQGKSAEDKLEGPVATLVQVNKLVQAIPKLTGKPLPANLGPLMDGITKAAVATSKDPALLAALSQTFGALSKVFVSSGLPAKIQSLGNGFMQLKGLLDTGIAPAIQRAIGVFGQAGGMFRTIGGLISGPVGSALSFGVRLISLFGEALSSLGMVLMANPVTVGITLLVMAILGALWYFRDALGGVVDVMTGAWKKLKSFFHLGGDDAAPKAASGKAPLAVNQPLPPTAKMPPVPTKARVVAAQPANLYMTHEGKAVLIATVTAGQTKVAGRPASGSRQADPTAMTIRSGMPNHIYARG